jgi:hypothetical protein
VVGSLGNDYVIIKISAFLNETAENWWPFPSLETTVKGVAYETGHGPFPDTDSFSIFDFLASITSRK